MKKETGKQVAKTYNKSISGDLIGDIRRLIETARHNVAVTVNASLTILYWKIGDRIRQDVLKEKRAEYGEEIISTLSIQLVKEFGNGFSRPNLFRMVRFAEVFPGGKIVSTLSRQLSWSHFVEIISLKGDIQRDFYAEMCRMERWSVRTLRKKIDGMLYERTAISKKPEELVKKELSALREEDRLTPDLVFRDPYFLDFLGLKDTYSEKDLETAILREMESFILELGAGFSFHLAKMPSLAILLNADLSNHLPKMPELAKLVNTDLPKGFTVSRVAEKHGWTEMTKGESFR